MVRRILITGASGMLGAAMAQKLSSEFKIFATGNSNYKSDLQNYLRFDLSSENYEELLNWSEPDLIIHCGAITNGNYCQENPLEAFNVNGLSIKKFLDVSRKDVKIIYISTDAVFPSKLHLAKETDCVNPENVYGKSKELGEFFLSNSDRDYLIIRTTIVGLNLNISKTGFVEWIINSARKGEKINLFDDVIFNPITIWDLISEISYLIKAGQFSKEILHISGSELITKHKFGKDLLLALKISGDKVFKGSIKNLPDRAKRCSDQSMDCTYYQNKYKRKLPELKDTLNQIKKQYYEKY